MAGQHVGTRDLAFVTVLDAIFLRCGHGTHAVSPESEGTLTRSGRPEVGDPKWATRSEASFTVRNLHTAMGYNGHCLFDEMG